MIKEEIKKIIEKAISNLYSDFNDRENRGIEILVEMPKEKSHGDYSTSISFTLGKIFKKNPNEIAVLLKTEIEKQKSIINKIEAVGGFINFFIKPEVFFESIKKIDKNFGKNNNLRNQKVIIEYTDPNPFKEFHIGHLMSNSIGESLSRIFEFQDTKIKRANYQGDVGIHVAKTMQIAMTIQARWEELTLGDGKKLEWGKYYSLGSERYESDQSFAERVRELNRKIYTKEDKEVNKLYELGKKISLEYFEEIYKKLGTKFDYYFFESEVVNIGKKIVEDGLKRGIFEKGDKGAIIFKGEKYGLHTRVFINSEGIPTYEAKELALAKVKYDKYKYDQSVVVTASEQNDYFKVVLCTLKQIYPELAQKTKHIGHGMMRLPEGKMSSRTGKVVTFESLLNKVEELVKEKNKDRDLSETEKKEIIEKVAIGALKYSILRQSIGSDIIYDFEKSISFEGDSGPYLQYSYARAMSVLKKAKSEKIKASFKNLPKEISQLEKDMNYFPEVVEKAGKEYEPHFIVLYLTELAREFNNYYAKNKIVDKADEFSPYKVALTEAFSIIMKNGLWLLEINTLEKM